MTIPEPMLAKIYNPKKVKNEKLFVQPKLDGVRCLVMKGPIYYSRQGNELYLLNHLDDEILRFCELLENGFLDGELYSEELSFQEIVSLVRRKDVKKIVPEIQKIKLFIFDYCSFREPMLPFSERIQDLLDVFDRYTEWKNIFLVPTQKFVGTRKELEKNYNKYSYAEGLIIRTDWPYFHGRTYALMKYKKFQDNEFKIVDIIPGKGRHLELGKMILETQDIDGKIAYFHAVMKGTDEQKKELLINKEKYIGKFATLKFQDLTEKGIPRFGIVVAIRDYE